MTQTNKDRQEYMIFLLEWIAHKSSPGNLEFEAFQKRLRRKHEVGDDPPPPVHCAGQDLAI